MKQSSSKAPKRSNRYNSAKGSKIMSPEPNKENLRKNKNIRGSAENVQLMGTMKRPL